MKKKLLSVFMCLVMAVTMFPLMGGVAFAGDADVPKPTGLHWDGTTACWDEVPGATKYWIYLYTEDHKHVTALGSDTNSYDFVDALNRFGSGKYYFYLSA